MTKAELVKFSENIKKQDTTIWKINPSVIDKLYKFDTMPKWMQWITLRWYDILDLYDKMKGNNHII